MGAFLIKQIMNKTIIALAFAGFKDTKVVKSK